MRIPRPEFPTWLRQRIDAREPTAVVRFGDGEVRLLEADPESSGSMQAALYTLDWQAIGSFSAEDVLDVKREVMLAFDNADVLGILANDSSERGKMWIDRLAALYAGRLAGGRPAATLTCVGLNLDLLDTLPEMLAGRRVSAISCRDLKPILEDEWGLEDVPVYQVPSESVVRDVDGPYEAAMHGVPIWPDGHARVHSELTVRERGEVFLVGAGVFGKSLCIRVRELGGIAIDMGSALDHVTGKLTRGPRRRAVDLRASGMSVDEIAARLRDLYDIEVDPDRVARGLEEVRGEVAALRRWQARED